MSPKIDENYAGFKLGELLLKTIFDFILENRFKSSFVEVARKQDLLIDFLIQFGFSILDEKEGLPREFVLGKSLSPTEDDLTALSASRFNRKFGPIFFSGNEISSYVIPIEPRFHDALFPELAQQVDFLTARQSYSNAIRKAYLCNANINTIEPDDLLWFYQSKVARSIDVLGVCEETLRTGDPEEMKRFLGTRTVYPEELIREKFEDGREPLGTRFRQVCRPIKPYPISKLLEMGVLNGIPQSIVTLQEESQRWLAKNLV